MHPPKQNDAAFDRALDEAQARGNEVESSRSDRRSPSERELEPERRDGPGISEDRRSERTEERRSELHDHRSEDPSKEGAAPVTDSARRASEGATGSAESTVGPRETDGPVPPDAPRTHAEDSAGPVTRSQASPVDSGGPQGAPGTLEAPTLQVEASATGTSLLGAPPEASPSPAPGEPVGAPGNATPAEPPAASAHAGGGPEGALPEGGAPKGSPTDSTGTPGSHFEQAGPLSEAQGAVAEGSRADQGAHTAATRAQDRGDGAPVLGTPPPVPGTLAEGHGPTATPGEPLETEPGQLTASEATSVESKDRSGPRSDTQSEGGRVATTTAPGTAAPTEAPPNVVAPEPALAATDRTFAGPETSAPTSSNTGAEAVAQERGREPVPGVESTESKSRPGPTVDTKRAADILNQVQLKLTPETRQATLRLRPESLGEVVIRLETDDGQVKAHMRVERPEAYAALERHAPELRAALESRGFENATLDLQLAPEGEAWQQSDSSASEHADGERPSGTSRSPKSNGSPSQDLATDPGVRDGLVDRLASDLSVDFYA